VDIIISEPIGVLLLHERMIETYVDARIHHLKPGGRMYPNRSIIRLCPFSDEVLYESLKAKVLVV
jgi:histone-arginine methyltransferase CARM1